MNYNNFLLLGLRCNILTFKHSVQKGMIRFDEVFDEDDFGYSIILIKKDSSDNLVFDGMIYFQTPKDGPVTLEKSKEYIHAIECAIPIYYFCIAKDASEHFSILPISDKMSSVIPPWSYNQIIKNCMPEILPGNYPSINFFESAFKSYTLETLECLKDMAPLVNLCWKNKKIYNSCSFLYSSIKKLGIDVCDWRDSNYSKEFDKYCNIGARESSFQDAYKAVEAIAGDFGGEVKRKQKIIEKLNSVGIDQSEFVGYREKEPLDFKLLQYASIRDKIAAHGSSKKKKIKLGETIDLQAIARHLIFSQVS